MKRAKSGLIAGIVLLFFIYGNALAESDCIGCHTKVSPGIVQDYNLSAHAENEVSCDSCHGEDHRSAEDYKKVNFPDEQVCSECHEDQFEQFSQGKHNFGWASLAFIPATHAAPDELVEGGRGCGGCHNMGIKTEAAKKELRDKGYRYQTNSCDECHTRHSFSKKETQNPRACQQCHMGYNHPQWEMWSSSKNGMRWFAKQNGDLPEGATAPTCQTCHLQDGSHTTETAWGFLGVRLPLPDDKQAAADRLTILKELGVLDPKTGQPTPLMEAVKAVRMIKLSQASWQKERDKMLNICSQCHSTNYVKQQLDMGDSIMIKADRMMAQAIETITALHKDGIIEKPANYPANYPFLLTYMHANGERWDKNPDKLSYIDQVLVQMYMKHRMRTYQGFFHVNPDYAYWYGWNGMTKDLGEILELARSMRVQHLK